MVLVIAAALFVLLLVAAVLGVSRHGRTSGPTPLGRGTRPAVIGGTRRDHFGDTLVPARDNASQ